MHEGLLRNLREEIERRTKFLVDGKAKDYTDYKVWCAEVRMLQDISNEILKAEEGDDE